MNGCSRGLRKATFRRLHCDFAPGGIIFDLIPANSTDTEIVRLGVREINETLAAGNVRLRL